MTINISNQTEKLLALSQLKGVGAKMLQSLQSVPDFECIELRIIISKYLPKGGTYTNSEINSAYDYSQRQIELALKNNHTIISAFDSNFPNSLRKTHDSPNLLFVAGDISQLKTKSITIIGTREPSEHGEVIAKRITKWFATKKWNVVSGLAYGVDKLAHEQCMDSGSKTIAVMAQGLEKVYPAKHKYLAERILDNGGVLLSEYAYGSFVGRANFVQRDRIQTGLASGVILIQSGLKGGSLHASRKAIEYERALIIAGQSKTDLAANIDNIQANVIFLKGSQKEIMDLLKVKSLNNQLIVKLENANRLSSTEELLIKINSQFNANTSNNDILLKL